ncbi:MAG TPA: 5-amino-6-(D-ribitylamino)uracil--L-tyrosine 4-hydroxyphenyl transferase CofH [Bryobacteraceae bacterium]|nr:5-amino-6-(D-ribitylamino)uracil--L-tyrosine 4-hydroxyphenyl transferase CofH [Bryobacteraceae bacterium]
MVDLATAISECDVAVASILEKSLSGRELDVQEGERLFMATGADLRATLAAADHLRRQRLGERVTYVVNRNINFTNVCVKRCGFCAFSRGHRAEEGYFLPLEEVVRRAKEGWELGATEVCVQAGLPPRMKGSLYIDLCRAIKADVPGIHVHGFSPEEVLYGAQLSGWSVQDYLSALKDAGVGSLPGTSAEILNDRVRDLISPGRISTADWIRVIGTAHRLGIPTTCTIMFGHIETARDCAEHIHLLREMQKETGGFTEFVPLSFIHTEAPMFQKSLVPGIRPGATSDEILRMYAVSRLMLNGWIDHVQASWVKQGPRLAQACLDAGADDLGGTLMNESISTAAGASHGHFLRPADIRALIFEAGRLPVERSTTYRVRRVFDREPEQPDALDLVESAGTRFGSYPSLISSDEFRYRKASRA